MLPTHFNAMLANIIVHASSLVHRATSKQMMYPGRSRSMWGAIRLRMSNARLEDSRRNISWASLGSRVLNSGNKGHAGLLAERGETKLLHLPILIQQHRGLKILGAEVKQGNIIERKGHIFQVLKTQHTQQGRGGATIQVELRDVQSGLKSSERLRTSEAIEKVFVDEKNFTFLYHDGDTAVLMEPETFEQMEVSKSMFGNAAAYLSDGLSVTLQLFDGKPLSAAVPSRVTCTVVEAEPSFKGQTATPVYKKALLQNGQQVMVPPFITTGDEIIIDTADNSYVTRAKA